MGRFSGKTVLVTGAQQGLGRAFAIAFAREGAAVVINYLDDRKAAEGVAADCSGAAGTALVQGDVARPDECRRIVSEAVGALGPVDVLINNAGMFPRVSFLEMEERDWDFVLDINLKGTCFCAQAAAKAMIAAGRRGAIVNLASAAVRGAVRGVHYTASKGGVLTMTRAMALELAEHGIRVNAIAPGLTNTAQPRYGHSEEELAEMAKAIPLGRMGQPDDIADVGLFLASDDARFITGQTVHVNGGSWMG